MGYIPKKEPSKKDLRKELLKVKQERIQQAKGILSEPVAARDNSYLSYDIDQFYADKTDPGDIDYEEQKATSTESEDNYADKNVSLDSYEERVVKAKLDRVLNKDYTKPCECKTIADCDNRCKGNAEDVLKELSKVKDQLCSEKKEGGFKPIGYDPLEDVEDDHIWEAQKKKKSAGVWNPYDSPMDKYVSEFKDIDMKVRRTAPVFFGKKSNDEPRPL
jgi:hypothetical protein